MKIIRWLVIVVYFSVAVMPLAWLAITSFKLKEDTISPTAKFIPVASKIESPDGSDTSVLFTASTDAYRRLGAVNIGSDYSFFHYLANSLIIGALSALSAVGLGTACAYGFSRFRIAGAKDWLFFILSTRFLPPLAVVVPVFMMYRQFNLQNTHVGLILLYTSFNLSLSVWLMKGFIDDIPRAYEDAALVDGYSRLQAFWRIIVPHAATGMAVTAVFCLISALNEYGFAMALNSSRAVTVPVYFAGLQGNISGVPWPQVAAGALVFVVPVAVFTVLVRKHLLRGVTFGTIKQ
ncbi:MAG: carbohydrate ABC transporter permease [Planctomycetes bacterium]|nr:carbohydrate ABC transporter permease [Planctomycetota bacterium]